MGLYISLGMPAEARVHWERADLIKDARFEHDDRRIKLRGHYPRRFDFGLGEFDVRELGDMICEDIRRELRNVQQTLSRFSNTDFREVVHIPHQIQARDYLQKRQCLYVWPYLLSRPFSATEAAAALAQMLLLSAEQAEESGDLGEGWRGDMHQIMEKTKSLRGHDFMIRNLCIDVEKLLSELGEDAKSADDLRGYLTGFMESIKKNCEQMVSHALKEIKPNDVLVLYGHSINVEQLLRDIDTRHLLYIVDSYKPLWGHEAFDENENIIRSVKDLGFGDKFRFLQLESLAAALGELKQKNVRCKLLLGTHGRLKCGDLLCKVGSYIIAETAKRFGAKVFAFCEKRKFLVESIEDYDIAGHEQLFSSEDEKKHPQMVDVPYVAPKMDRVPKRLVDVVITEDGVERRRKRKKSSACRSLGKAKGKKASKAR
jgi:translation initiation factor 2B subunit (eIF-2B alpha/beta/delta family)